MTRMFLLASTMFAASTLLQGQTFVDSLPTAHAIVEGADVPLVYSDSCTAIADTISVVGIVEQVTVVPISCGVSCAWGTVRVKLQHRPIGYPCDVTYLAVRCLTGSRDSYLNRNVSFRAVKLLRRDILGTSCPGVFNSINSGGISFYRPLEDNVFLNR